MGTTDFGNIEGQYVADRGLTKISALTLSARTMLRARLRTTQYSGSALSVENAKRQRTQGGGILVTLINRRPRASL